MNVAGNVLCMYDEAWMLRYHACRNGCDAFSAGAGFSMACGDQNAQSIGDVCQYGCISAVF